MEYDSIIYGVAAYLAMKFIDGLLHKQDAQDNKIDGISDLRVTLAEVKAGQDTVRTLLGQAKEETASIKIELGRVEKYLHDKMHDISNSVHRTSGKTEMLERDQAKLSKDLNDMSRIFYDFKDASKTEFHNIRTLIGHKADREELDQIKAV